MSELKKVTRQPFYTIVENMLGRPLTKEEHYLIKNTLIEYSELQLKMIADLNEMIQRQGSTRKNLARALYKAIRKQFTEEDMAFLKKMAEEQ